MHEDATIYMPRAIHYNDTFEQLRRLPQRYAYRLIIWLDVRSRGFGGKADGQSKTLCISSLGSLEEIREIETL